MTKNSKPIFNQIFLKSMSGLKRCLVHHPAALRRSDSKKQAKSPEKLFTTSVNLFKPFYQDPDGVSDSGFFLVPYTQSLHLLNIIP